MKTISNLRYSLVKSSEYSEIERNLARKGLYSPLKAILLNPLGRGSIEGTIGSLKIYTRDFDISSVYILDGGEERKIGVAELLQLIDTVSEELYQMYHEEYRDVYGILRDEEYPWEIKEEVKSVKTLYFSTLEEYHSFKHEWEIGNKEMETVKICRGFYHRNAYDSIGKNNASIIFEALGTIPSWDSKEYGYVKSSQNFYTEENLYRKLKYSEDGKEVEITQFPLVCKGKRFTCAGEFMNLKEFINWTNKIR